MSTRLLAPFRAAFPSRTWAAATSTVSAGAVAVVINVWTANWTWPAGVGFGTLLLFQALFEWNRARAIDDAPSTSSGSGWTVEQHIADVSDSDVTAACRSAGGGDTEVRQRLGTVSRSTIVGIDGSSNQ